VGRVIGQSVTRQTPQGSDDLRAIPISNEELTVSSEAAREMLIGGARALAHADSLASSLDSILGVLAERLDVESAVVVVPGSPDQLVIVASVGLEGPALAGLAEALRNPGHPIARTLVDPVVSFDVLPSVAGGPARRSHLPLTVTRNGADRVLGVLALAHDRPIEADSRGLIEAAADLAAVAVERHRRS
jgi:GAF domain-containing protein